MKKKLYCPHPVTLALLACLLTPAWSPAAGTNAGYAQMNLVADTNGVATNVLHLNANLLNPWGLVVSPEAIWVNDNHSGLMQTFSPLGAQMRRPVNLPAPGAPSGGAADGLVGNDTGQFLVSKGAKKAPATFLMATEDGTILAWNPSITGSNAVIVVDNSASGAIYKGLAIALDENGAPHLYAANFGKETIDEFDGQFHPIQSFTDPELPELPGGQFWAPFNIRPFRGRLFVAFAVKTGHDAGDDTAGAGNGAVDVFGTDGTLLRHFAEGGVLNSPWGMAIAPRHFGKFSRALLVGNFGDGTINAYDLLTGRPLGDLKKPDGSDLVIDGLWGLSFEREEVAGEECGFDAQRLYFTAGPAAEAHGLLGFLRPVSPAFPPAH